MLKGTTEVEIFSKLIDYRYILTPHPYRLLSQQGLPKLRRTAPEQLGKKLKGKGHEYTDAARILNFYQLWADDLYRKANFRDIISIIEKLGHTKRVQIARNQYLDDLLPKNIPSEIEAEIERQEKGKQTEKAKEQDNDDDLYEPAPQGASRRMQEDNGGSLFLGGANDDSDDDDVFGAQPNDAELDALMRQEASVDIPVTVTAATKEKEKPKTVEDDFGDGFEAIDDWDEIMDGAASQVQSQVISGNTSGATKSIFDGAMVAEDANDSSMIPPDDIGDDDEDALEAMYGF